ncbi:hypothetical protein AA313_de0209860 [Arthrobotrys entomopaga]|nr:hypothetical protein AA313_de0209860 [Arthrobotrys entomopaga]
MVDGRTNMDLNTPLLPFKHADGSWWTSADTADVRSMWKDGYGYPEVSCSKKSLTDEQLDAFTTSQVNVLYKDALPDFTVQRKARIRAKRDVSESVIQWSVNIVIDQSELPGTFQIMVFLGEPPADSQQWNACDQKIGGLTVFGTPGIKMPSKILTSDVALTAALQSKGLGTDATKIDDYLAKNLVWKCLDDEGHSVNVTTLSTLKVGVTNHQVDIPTKSFQKPKFFNPRLRMKGTRRKKGGVDRLSDLRSPRLRNGKHVSVSGSFASITVASVPVDSPTATPTDNADADATSTIEATVEITSITEITLTAETTAVTETSIAEPTTATETLIAEPTTVTETPIAETIVATSPTETAPTTETSSDSDLGS